MELEDLKPIWNKTSRQEIHSPEAIQRILGLVTRSRNRITNTFIAETFIAIAVYAMFSLFIFYFDRKVQTFLYKIVFATLIFIPPIYYRLFKSIQLLKKMDFGKDLRTNMITFISYYKTTLQVYRWCSYLMVLIVLVLILTDDSFYAESRWIQIAVIGYLLVAMALIWPLVNRLYGKHIDSMELFLKE